MARTIPKTHAIIIDFMALVRKIPLKKLDPPVKTFHDFAIALTFIVIKAGQDNDEIHIVFDHYKEDSYKNSERSRRGGKSKEMVVLDKILPNQNVPVVLESFGHLPSAKLLFRFSMLNAMLTSYINTYYQLPKLQTSIPGYITPSMASISWVCFSFSQSQMHT